MKIVTDKAVYIQKNDIIRLSQSYLNIPESVFLQIYATGVIIADDKYKYEFIKIELDKEIDFFKSIDWIIDYNEVKDLSENEIIELSQKFAQEKNENFFEMVNKVLKTNYSTLKKELKIQFPFLEKAINFGHGIRLLNQDIFETHRPGALPDQTSV